MSNTSSSAIDLSLLAPPDVVKQISFEEILKLRLEQFYQEMRQDQPEFPDLLESDPAMKLAQVFAYGEMLIRQDTNEQALAVLLAFAKDNDLDHKAAERNLQRRIISPATENTLEVKESNESLRRRVQLAPEGQTTAGSEGSYIFHGLNADPRVKDVYPYAPLDENENPTGICNIYVLSNEGTGEASEELLNVVTAALNAKSVRPLTDRPIVYSASILNYSIQAEIFIDEGPDENIVLNSCYKAAEEYTNKTHSFNDGVSLSGIYQALHQPGVSRVNLISPAGNLDTSLGQVAYCTGINISRASL
ncbi:baseplate J family protein [Acinetobacter cumulans]|uniref:Baseplate J family protein n=1 Tax=Acinetobacter cumulans TaxID=2136182 RepID=A0A498CU73_9GAMM|nr:baseplate J/gp47 family protein [Acinetobacter cumulans]RLL33734.1 baseplate J family protein [Acinetobacter cumulans]